MEKTLENTKLKQKEIACQCLKSFKVLDNVINEFKDEGTVYYSERLSEVFDGILYWVSNHPEWEEMIKKVEEEYNILVYHAYLYHTVYGDVLDCLYVPADEEDYEYILSNIKDGIASIYAIDIADSTFSEFGLGQYKPCNGGITKIA